jgi:hypothetical protein
MCRLFFFAFVSPGAASASPSFDSSDDERRDYRNLKSPTLAQLGIPALSSVEAVNAPLLPLGADSKPELTVVPAALQLPSAITRLQRSNSQTHVESSLFQSHGFTISIGGQFSSPILKFIAIRLFCSFSLVSILGIANILCR